MWGQTLFNNEANLQLGPNGVISIDEDAISSCSEPRRLYCFSTN